MLNSSERRKTIIRKTNKSLGLFCKLQTLLPRAPLVTLYKSFIRPDLDYGNVIYDQTFNMLFQQNMETIITGAIKGFSREKLYQELGLETL